MIQTIYQQFRRTVSEYADKPFIHIPTQACSHYSQDAIDYSYQAADDIVCELRQRYHQAGYGCGQRIALVLENRAEFFFHFLALNSLGVCVVPVNAEFVADEIEYLILNSESSLVVCLPEHIEKVQTALKDADTPIAPHTQLTQTRQAASPAEQQSAALKTPAAIIYTSGTTGKPKGCVLSNEYFLYVGDWYLNLGGYCKLQKGCERVITPLPFFHVNALAFTAMAMIMSGGCLIQLDRFHPSNWWQTVRESKATCLHYLGVMPAMLLKLPQTEQDNLAGQIKFGFGAGIEPEHHATFEQRFGFPLIEGWAMTETGAAACFMTNQEPRHIGTRCIGIPPSYMEYRIIDDDGQDVDKGEAGEFLVRRAGDKPRQYFFSEYYKNPQATAESWKNDWFYTGDIVREGKDKSLFFVERKKNIIRRSGENIAAAEVESILLTHPAITNCAVAPFTDPVRGEEVFACIEATSNVEHSLELASSIVSYCLGKLSYFKAPGYIAFVKQLPVTSTQKIQRGEIRRLCAEQVEADKYFDLRKMKKKA